MEQGCRIQQNARHSLDRASCGDLTDFESQGQAFRQVAGLVHQRLGGWHLFLRGVRHSVCTVLGFIPRNGGNESPWA